MNKASMMKKGNTTFIVLVIVLMIAGLVAVLVISGFGVGQNIFNKNKGGVGPQVPNDSQVQLLDEQSTSDEIVAIENDLDGTELENLDSDLNDIFHCCTLIGIRWYKFQYLLCFCRF